MSKINVTEHKHGGLNQLSATAICGNDITSSCLYVSALAIFYSGKWAPVALLIVAGGNYLMIHGAQVLLDNLSTPTPGGLKNALFFGFSASLLGISGFESSANFIEEQAETVFPQTLRNLWVAVYPAPISCTGFLSWAASA